MRASPYSRALQVSRSNHETNLLRACNNEKMDKKKKKKKKETDNARKSKQWIHAPFKICISIRRLFKHSTFTISIRSMRYYRTLIFRFVLLNFIFGVPFADFNELVLNIVYYVRFVPVIYIRMYIIK